MLFGGLFDEILSKFTIHWTIFFKRQIRSSNFDLQRKDTFQCFVIKGILFN